MSHVRPPLIKGPLTFGDREQINEIKRVEAAEERAIACCHRCDGEGMIECPDCDGDGMSEEARRKEKEGLSKNNF